MYSNLIIFDINSAPHNQKTCPKNYIIPPTPTKNEVFSSKNDKKSPLGLYPPLKRFQKENTPL